MVEPKCISALSAFDLCESIVDACERAKAIHAAQCVALTSDTSAVADDHHDHLRAVVEQLLGDAQRAARELHALVPVAS